MTPEQMDKIEPWEEVDLRNEIERLKAEHESMKKSLYEDYKERINRVGNMQIENAKLKSKLSEQQTIIDARGDEIERHVAEIEQLVGELARIKDLLNSYNRDNVNKILNPDGTEVEV